jgi:outer membrane protein OmpA-like peptidoglycan-associated protein
MRVRGLTAALLVIIATAAAAQTPGSYEINGFGRYTRFDNTLGPNNEFGGGGSLGFFLLSNLALEAEGAYTATQDGLANSVTNIPLRGRLSYHVPLGGNASSLRIGAGYVRNLYRKNVSFDDDGFTGIFGIRLGLGPVLGLRFDGTADYFRSPDAGRAKYVNWGSQAGLSFVFGNSRSTDKDKDGIRNNLDRCPKSPAGKTVDSAGCAASQLDTDRDRVNDELDRCPSTPAGETVDPAGCSAGQRDADQDGVITTEDRCPNTPAGERVDAEGCATSQKDDDADGIMNPADRCPGTGAGEQVDPAGCAAGQRDSDRDGVHDGADECPNTPVGEQVNPRGCHSERDADADGIPDGRDRCPSTLKGQPIDENGCPILFQRGARSVILRGVTFQVGKAALTPHARDVLRDIATQLVDNPITGYRSQVTPTTPGRNPRICGSRWPALGQSRPSLLPTGFPQTR